MVSCPDDIAPRQRASLNEIIGDGTRSGYTELPGWSCGDQEPIWQEQDVTLFKVIWLSACDFMRHGSLFCGAVK